MKDVYQRWSEANEKFKEEFIAEIATMLIPNLDSGEFLLSSTCSTSLYNHIYAVKYVDGELVLVSVNELTDSVHDWNVISKKMTVEMLANLYNSIKKTINDKKEKV